METENCSATPDDQEFLINMGRALSDSRWKTQGRSLPQPCHFLLVHPRREPNQANQTTT